MIDGLARTIWDYMLLHHQPKKSELIFVLGSRDDTVASYAAELYRQGLAPQILVSGGIAHANDILATPWEGVSEAAHFAGVMIKAGVPADVILQEDQALNTGHNITLGYQLLKSRQAVPQRMILVQKPYMERRTFATFKKQWPEESVDIAVTSPPISFDQYFDKYQPKDRIISTMVGDLQRIIEYPKMGFQIYQAVPNNVLEAYEKLIKEGYTKHLIKSS